MGRPRSHPHKPASDDDDDDSGDAGEAGEAEARIANLERIATATQAKQLKGHRKAGEIQADLDAARKTLLQMLADRDGMAAREIKERKLYESKRRLAMEDWARAGIDWNEAEWAGEQKAPYRVPAAFCDQLHRQHYAVATVEAELEDLRQAVGAEAFAEARKA